MVQAQIKSQTLRVFGKEFAFTKLMQCGQCSSGITAQEKFKKLKDGSVNRHVYYNCAKSKNKECPGTYINEEELLKQFEALMDRINLNEIEIREKIKEEVGRFKKFQRVVLGTTADEVKVGEIDIRNYAKYILRDGTDIEKKELLGCLKSKICLKDKAIYLET